MAPDRILPPSASSPPGEAAAGPPPLEGEGKVLLGDGWKPLCSGFVADQFVKLVRSRLEAKGLEAAPADDDNVEILKNTLIATLHNVAPSLQVPWWIGLPVAMFFVYLDLRVAARRIEGNAIGLAGTIAGEPAAAAEAPAPASAANPSDVTPPAPAPAPVDPPAPSSSFRARFDALRPPPSPRDPPRAAG